MKAKARCYSKCIVKKEEGYNDGKNSLCLKCIKGQIARAELADQLVLFEIPGSYFDTIGNM